VYSLTSHYQNKINKINFKIRKIIRRDYKQTLGAVVCGTGIRRQGLRCNFWRQASKCDARRHKIVPGSERQEIACVRLKTSLRGEATGDKSLDRELRETGIQTKVSPTARMRHGHPRHLILSRQNIFFVDDTLVV